MKKRLSYLVICILLSNALHVLGQGPIDKLWEISLSGGFSFPIGVFSNNSPASAAILDKNVPFTRIIGISKSNNGFALIGYNYNLLIKYKVSPSLRLLFLNSRYINPVQTNGLTAYLTQTYNLNQEYWESNYKTMSFTPGIGYETSLSNFVFGLGIYMGYSFTEYPYYKFIQLYTMLDPPPIFAHDGSKSALHAFSFGSSISISYRISNRINIAVDAIYSSSNFKYNMSNTMIPGGSQVFEISDILKVRVINTVLSIGYCF